MPSVKPSAFAAPGGVRSMMAFGSNDVAERLEDHRLAILHAEREDLHDEDVAEAIDDQPGDAVALGMHHAVAGGLGRAAEAELQPAGERTLELGRGRARVDGRRLVAHEEAHRDRRAGRVESATEEVAARVDDADLVAARRSAFDPVDRLRVDPGVARPDGLNVTRLEPNRCQVAALYTQATAAEHEAVAHDVGAPDAGCRPAVNERTQPRARP